MTTINFFSMPNLFSFVINMLNQIYNDHKKERKTQTENIYIYVQLKYVSKEKKKKKGESEKRRAYPLFFAFSLCLSFSLVPIIVKKTESTKEQTSV